MASIERTAYPRFGKRMSAEELRARYELSDAEHDFVSATANGGRQRLVTAPPSGIFSAAKRMDRMRGRRSSR